MDNWKLPVFRDQWQLDVAAPLLKRLLAGGYGWQAEDDVCGGDVQMTIIGARCFWAKQLGLIEYRKRSFRRGWWIRLTTKGVRYARGL